MESQSENTFQKFLNRVLNWSGGYYLVLSIIAAQMGSTLVAIPIMLIAQINAEFSYAEFNQLSQFTGWLAMTGNLALWVLTYFINKQAFHGLQQHKKGAPLPGGSAEELKAWKQVSTWTWKYAITASFTNLVVVGIPILSYLQFYLHATYDQLIYILISITIVTLSIITLDVSILDRLLIPVRHALLPRHFDAQLEGATGLTLLGRLYVVVPAMITLSILLIAPIGYHQTTRVLYQEIGSAQVLRELQVQSIIVSAFVILLGLGLVYLFSLSLTRPLNEMIGVFKKVEQGDLKQRAQIIASDEIAQVTIFFNRMISRLDELQETLERQVEDRTAQLRAINEVGRVATSTLDPDELMTNIVNLIQERFGNYYTAIYLQDASGRWAELKEATGEAGRALKESNHRLEINEQTMIGRAIKRRDTQVSMNTDKKSTRFEHLLLAYTRSEITVALIIGERILGALDVQSTQEAAFSQQDIETIQNMANQVAIALENARLFRETQQNLQELRNIQRQYLRQTWSVSSLSQGEVSFSIGDDSDLENKQTIEVPLTLRDQIIGNIRLEREQTITPDESAWIQAIATQTALALENARLLEETQNTANREKAIAEISNKIWASTSMEGILQTTIRELGAVLDASEATIELEMTEK